MITFEQIRYENFLSVGNNPVVIDLQRSPTTLITGSNGAGKSTLTCALTFALFGKSYRGVSKPSLVNTVNQKGLSVELDFCVGSDKYKIHRGIKPNIFDIYKNGNKLDNDAAVRDQQKYLEESILKSNFKSFCQVVVIGTASYVPFMKLNAGQRREFIEGLLGISVFSDMNKLLKNRISLWKQEMDVNKRTIVSVQSQIEMQKGFIDKLQQSGDELKSKKQKELKILRQRTEAINEQISELEHNIEVEQDALYGKELKALQETEQNQKSLLAVEKSNLKQMSSQKSFFNKNRECPTCDQDISEEWRSFQMDSLSDKVASSESTIANITNELTTIGEAINDIQIANTKIAESKRNLTLLKTKIEEITKSAGVIIEEMKSVSNKNEESLLQEKETLQRYLGQLELLENQQKELLDQKQVYDTSASLLKDTGIKSRIIREYIPVINNSVNRYLSILGFNVVFELDENFNETLKARYKDEFTYNNLSMGERQRLDLAITFAWRDVARQKNSANMNIMFLDETFDSSLDSQGADDLSSILKLISKKNNVFVISHKGLSDDMFRSSIRFEKKNGFTRMAA